LFKNYQKLILYLLHPKSLEKFSKANGEIIEAIRWSRCINTWKSLHEHSVNSGEISALIAIQEFEEALQKIYLIPDLIARTRLLGQAYTEMKSNQIFIGNDQLDELQVLIKSIRIDEIDKNIVQELAIDIFEILPDEAIALLERMSSESDKKNLLDLAITSKALPIESEELPKRANIEINPALEKRKGLYSHWIKGLSFSELILELEKIDKTRAKEYMIRRWCIQIAISIFR
jgi:hypothetical protein